MDINSTLKPLGQNFSGGLVVKNLPAKAGDTGSIPFQEDFTCQGATEALDHNY